MTSSIDCIVRVSPSQSDMFSVGIRASVSLAANFCVWMFGLMLICFSDSNVILCFQVKIERIHIDGLGRTQDDIAIAQIKDVFQASTFKELIQKSGEAKLKLEQLGIFSGVGVLIDTSKGKQAYRAGILSESENLSGKDSCKQKHKSLVRFL